ncbi:MAG: M23 family metallopeptidase, partial [Pseudomonadota bacterium]
ARDAPISSQPRNPLSPSSPALRLVNGVALATAPLKGACVTSGYGRRWGRLHKGVDLAPEAPGRPLPTIVAAADGVVREKRTYRGYGRTLVIDHGDGVFTRYAHLSRFAKGVGEGRRVAFGQPIGTLGASGGRRMGVHLHYEILTGAYREEKLAFALDGRDPLRAPGLVPPVDRDRRMRLTLREPDALAHAAPKDPGRSRSGRSPSGSRWRDWRNSDA